MPLSLQGQVSFSQSTLNFNGNGGVNGGTSLMFGPDGRLYVLSINGAVDIFTVQRNGPDDYVVIASEELLNVQNIPNHNDDGTSAGNNTREATGLTVAGTAANPVIYVTSSDPRIGGPGGDLGLDTNSGVITRFYWNGTSWEVVDLVRGLPRSEENHATNGLEFVTVNGTDYLIVCQGGHTNAGSPSDNFAWTTEYALSAALLSVNLTMLEGMSIQTDPTNGRSYIYDLPTLDDPTRPNANGVIDPDDPAYNGIDQGDPWGGNDGLNQAMIVPGGPVQIFSPGYRNTYDLVVTAGGAVFCTDNGANGGWGGLPDNEGGGSVTNNYISGEPGSGSSVGGEQVNNADHLTLITSDIQGYSFGSFYGGHAAPIRANPAGAGLYTNPTANATTGAVFRTQVYDPDGSTPGSTTDPNLGLPANWPPVPVGLANPVEGDWRAPGGTNPDGPDDVLVTTWGTNTNGIDEYTASNFGGAMQGDLIAGKNGGQLRRVQLNPDNSLNTLTNVFISNLGGNALGVTCNSDSDPFPGTIWVAPYNGNIIVMEPQDFVICILPGDVGYDPNSDNDSDGYTNQDEIDSKDAGEQDIDVICNGGNQPDDFDKSAGGSLVSDLNDPDDDADGIPDASDVMQLGVPTASGSDAFDLPVINELFSDNPDLKGYLGLGFTGMMNNGDPNPNWLNWLDRRDNPADPNPNDILGGAVGAMTMQMTAGTALGSANNQEKGFQYGVNVDLSTSAFSVEGALLNFTDPLQLYGASAPASGELGIFIGDGTQSNYLKVVINQAGIEAVQEIADVPQTPVSVAIPVANRPANVVKFRLNITCATGDVAIEYSLDNGAWTALGNITAAGSILTAIQQASNPLIVGLTGSSNQAGAEVEGTWDYLNVTGAQPTIAAQIPDQEAYIGDPAIVLNLDNFFDDDGGVANLTYTVANNTNTAIGAAVSGSDLTITIPGTAEVSDITVRATDVGGLFTEQTFTTTVTDEPVVLFRVNAGGALIAATDAPNPDWAENAGTGAVSGTGFTVNTGSTSSFTTTNLDPSVPAYAPTGLFSTERWDDGPAPEMEYSFTTGNGTFIVNLYFKNGWSGTSGPGQRIFDVQMEGNTVLANLDLSATYGHETGVMISSSVTVTDGTLEILFIHGTQNPLVNAIEILGIGAGYPPINVTQISTQNNNEGDLINLPVAVSGGNPNENFGFAATGLPAGLQIEPTTGLIFGNIDPGEGANSPFSVQVTVSKPSSTDAVMNFTWNVGATTTASEALVEIIPLGNNINASTFGNTSFQITNNSPSANITSVTFDMTTGFLPDMVFDPNGTAGDLTSKPFTPSGTPTVGTITDVFGAPLGNGGFQELVLTFTDFNPGESLQFGLDQDPTSIEGLTAPGPNDAGSVSGLEQIGSTITVAFDDGSSYTTNLFSDGSNAGGTSVARVNLLAAPTLTIQGLNSPATTNNASQTLLITGGPANGTVALVQVEAGFFEGGGNLSQEPYEVNSVISVNRTTGIQLDASGAATVSVNLLDTNPEAGYNYFLVAAEDGNQFGLTSNPVVIYYDDQFTPPVGNVLYRVNAGGPLVAATDAPNPDWSEDAGNFGAAGNSPYLVASSGTGVYSTTSGSAYPGPVDTSDPSIPAGTAPGIFETERYDAAAAPEMKYEFPVTAGFDYEVRIYLAEIFNGITAAGERVFDVSIEGSVPTDMSGLDPFGLAGAATGFMVSHTLTAGDNLLEIEFIHDIENPAIKAIEIIENPVTTPMADIAISATLQGRSDHSGDYTVKLYPVGSVTEIGSYTVTADASGNMTLSGIAPGDYQVALKYPNSLQKVMTGTLAVGTNSMTFGELPTGDFNGDNAVTLIDFSGLVGTFNLASGDPQFNGAADFNGDTGVTLLDFSLLVTNFNTGGEEPSN